MLAKCKAGVVAPNFRSAAPSIRGVTTISLGAIFSFSHTVAGRLQNKGTSYNRAEAANRSPAPDRR